MTLPAGIDFGAAFFVAPLLMFPLVSIVFTVNVYSLPFVRPVIMQLSFLLAIIKLSFSRADKLRLVSKTSQFTI